MKLVTVAIDETPHYNFQAEDAPFIKQMLGVYAYDPEERTFCCEITPSHWMEHLYDTAVTTDECPEEIRERISERYTLCDAEPGFYMHCRDAEQLPLRTKPEDFADMEEAREYLCGNCPF